MKVYLSRFFTIVFLVSFNQCLYGQNIDIRSTGGGVDIKDDDMTPSLYDETDFGGIRVGSTITKSYTIRNTNSTGKYLDYIKFTGSPKVEISGTHADDFTVTVEPSKIHVNKSTIITIEFNPSALGIREAEVTINNDSWNHKKFNFKIQGVGLHESNKLFNASRKGSDIDGESGGDNSGFAVSLSEDGGIMAIGAPLNDGSATTAGHVKVYEWDSKNDRWSQLGSDIEGDAAGDEFGGSLSLSKDGNRLIVGAKYNDGSATDAGQAKVYEWDTASSEWVQLGADIEGDASGDWFGSTVCISGKGEVLAIGAQRNDGSATNAGHVKIFEWDSSSSEWDQIGSDLEGEASGDNFGKSVSLSLDGKVVAIGAIFNDGTASNAGHVQVFEWNETGSEWNQLGSDFNGEAASDNFGISTSLSGDGLVVAIGANKNDDNGADAGHVRVLKYNASNDSWSLLGSDIVGEASGDEFGNSVSLSDDGELLVVGALNNDGTATDAGHVRVFAWDNDSIDWVQLESDFDGESGGDNFGKALSLSSDGKVLAIGAINNDGSATDAGHVRVFEFEPNPEIAITGGNNVEIKDEDASPSVIDITDFGGVPVDETISATFTLKNIGLGLLNLTGNPLVQISGTNASDFTVSAQPSADSIIGLEEITFEIEFKAGAIGVRSAEVTITNNDPDESTYNFNIQGLGIVESSPVLSTDDIDGEAAGDYSGSAVQLSDDASVLAIGAYENDGGGSNAGHVRVFEWDTTNVLWKQKGADIDGENRGDRSGYSLSLSSTGQQMAIGAIRNDGGGNNSGHVRIYYWRLSTDKWKIRGNDIDGENADDNFGVSVSISDDGLTFIAGAPLNDGAGTSAGHVRIFDYNSSTKVWDQRGSDIDGSKADDRFGSSVAISGDGNIIVVGARLNDDGGTDAGHAKVYEWDAVAGDWKQRGISLEGDGADDNFGTSVSISNDGKIVAIGAPNNDDKKSNSGHVKVFEWNSTDSLWIQVGANIEGESDENFSGKSVSLSNDGKTIAIGAPANDGNGTYSGHVRVYEWNALSGEWIQSGQDNDGESSNDRFGYAVSLSSDGNTLAAGAYLNEGNGTNAGHVQVLGEPEIFVIGGDELEIVTGDKSPSLLDETDFGAAPTNGTITKTFYIGNTGKGVLKLLASDTVIISGTNSNSFKVTSQPSGIEIGKSDTLSFTVEFTAKSLGIHEAEIQIASNDPEVATYSFAIQGLGITPSNSKLANGNSYGNNLEGDVANDNFGHSVALSRNGQTLASSSIYNDGSATDAGHVRVFNWDSEKENWYKLGDDIEGEKSGDNSGYSIALSKEGDILAIGALNNDGTGTNAGHVRVFEWESNDSSWNQLGVDLEGDASDDAFGYSVAISSDGSILAVGAIGNDDNGSNAGQVQVFAWNNSKNEWMQIGDAIEGESSGDAFGSSIGISEDGKTIAIGATKNDGGGTDAGHVQVYEWDATNEAWNKLGHDLDGGKSGDSFGHSLSLSSDGQILAIGALLNDGGGTDAGQITVYSWDAINNEWDLLGSAIEGDAAGDNFGTSVSLTSDGRIMAIGAKYNDGNGTKAGHIKVYEWDETNADWIQIGNDIDGEASNDEFGYSVAISGDGLIVAGSAVENDGFATSAGNVRAFSLGQSEIEVIGANDLEIVDGDSTASLMDATDFGGAPLNGTISNTFTINNKGDALLTLANEGLVSISGIGASNFTVTANPLSDSLKVLESVTFTIEFEPSELGIHQALVSIGSNDADEPNYTFSIQGIGIPSSVSIEDTATVHGDDIDGWAQKNRHFGYSVALSSNGNIMASGAIQRGTYKGKARVYQWDEVNEEWILMGSELTGESNGDRFGHSVSLSDDGLTLAVGAIQNDASGANAGHVRVYTWDAKNDEWDQLGSDIDGEASGDLSGWSIDLSGDGAILAIGATLNDDGGTDAGQVRVFEWDSVNNQWSQMGADIDGDASDDRFGISVSLSSDGKTLAAGAIQNDGSSTNEGQVKIFEWDADKGAWLQMGADIYGESKDYSGVSVSLSDDGKTVAIGASRNDGGASNTGQVRVFEYRANSNKWIQLGDDMKGEAADDLFGIAVSLSSDGKTVAAGANENDGSFSNAGHVRVFAWDSSSKKWLQVGTNLNGEGVDDQSGSAIHLSSDASRLAVGAYYNDGTATNSGHVRVYNLIPEPEIMITGGKDIEIKNGDISPSLIDETDFGGVAIGGNIVHEFTIKNNGVSILELTGSTIVTISGTNASDFTVLKQPLNSEIGISGSLTFEIEFKASSIGIHEAEVTIASNDSNETNYTFSIQGVGVIEKNKYLSNANQQGTDLDGDIKGDHMGWAVSLSDDGGIMAAGLRYHDGNGTNSGAVRVFEWDVDSTKWDQVGQDIEGEAAYDNSGISVSLTSNGQILAIGAINNDDSGSNAGHVRVFKWDSVNVRWTQLGSDIDGEASDDNFGVSVSLSSNGDILAIGGYKNDDEASDAGHARVFAWDSLNSEWEQIGSDIDGEAKGDNFGRSVSLSDDGKTLAIGGVSNNGTASDAGHIRVFEWDETNEDWQQVGLDIDGEAQGDRFGAAVSISSDGKTVIGGAFNNDGTGSDAGHVRIFEWNADLGEWSQKGKDLDGEGTGDKFGRSVSISNDGNLIAAGGSSNDGFASNAGHVRLFIWDDSNSEWVQLGSDIDGETSSNELGWSVSLSADGTILAAGAPYNDDKAANAGHVRIYNSGLPEISVKGNSIEIEKSDNTPSTLDNTDFGCARVLSGTVTKTFTIENIGASTLSLTGTPIVSIGGTNSSDFAITSQPADTFILPSRSQEFVVEFDPSATGLRLATISIANSDDDEALYTFDIEGNGSANIEVTSGNDSGAGTLRQALADVCDGDEITFNGVSTITLTSDVLLIDKAITINGGSGVTIQRNTSSSDFGIFQIITSDTVSLNDLTILNGKQTNTDNGSGIYSESNLVIDNCIFENNETDENGGAIFMNSNAVLNLSNSAFRSNSASNGGALFLMERATINNCEFSENNTIDDGGAVFIENSDTSVFVNCTFYENDADSNGGAISLLKGVVDLINCTVSDNTATYGSGGGIHNYILNSSKLTIKNTIIADNINANGKPDLAGTITSNGYNLLGDIGSQIFTTSTGDLKGTSSDPIDAELNALATFTGSNLKSVSLGIGSPAINSGSNVDAPSKDQVGQARVGDTDIGAFESQSPVVVSVTSTNANDTYIIGDEIDIVVEFNAAVFVTGTPQLGLETGTTDAVVDYYSGSGSTKLIFSYDVSSGEFSSDLDVQSNGALVLNSGTIKSQSGNDATLLLPVASDINSLSDNKDLIIDGLAPEVLYVTSEKTNGVYSVGDNIDIQVVFSEPVSITGTPQITLETGLNDQVINYSSGSTTDTLTFSYSVQAGNSSLDLDYVASSSLVLNNGTILDKNGNETVLTLPNPGNSNSLSANKNLIIDTDTPTVLSVSSINANGTFVIGDVISINIVFDKEVDVTGTPQLELETGTTDRIIDYISGSGTDTLTFEYTVQEGDNSSDLEYTSQTALSLNGGSIKFMTIDAILDLQPLGNNSLADNKNLEIDGIKPKIQAVSSTNSDGYYKENDIVVITLRFDDLVYVTGTPKLLLETGTTDAEVEYTSGSSSRFLSFYYEIDSTHESSDLDYASTAALTLNGGSIKDVNGNDVNLTLFAPGKSGSLGANKDLVIDNSGATVSSVTSSTDNGNYKQDDEIKIVVHFDEIVYATGTPQIELETGTTNQKANYASGSGSDEWIFIYKVQAGDSTTDLAYVDSTSLTLNGGSIKDAAGNNAILTLFSPGSANSLSNNKNLVIDTKVPNPPLISSITNDNGLSNSDGITNDQTLIISGSSEANSTVIIYRDGASVGNTSTSSLGAWEFNYTNSTLSEGLYVFTAKAQDSATNLSNLSNDFELEIDVTLPSKPNISSISDDSGSSSSDGLTSDQTLLFYGTAEEGSRVTLYADGVSIGTDMVDGNGEWTFDYSGTNLAEGIYYISAIAMDTAGNNSFKSRSFKLNIDTTPPNAPLFDSISTDNGASSNDEITSDSTLIFYGRAEAYSKVEVFIDSVSIGSATANGSGNWVYDNTGSILADDTYGITAIATDSAGNVSSISSAFSVKIDENVTKAPNAPVISAITNDNGLSGTDGKTNDQTLVFTGTAEANSTVIVFRDGANVGSTTANGTGSWTFDYTASTLSNGLYVFTAKAQDAASNLSAASADFDVSIDATAPSTPSIASISSDLGRSGTDGITTDQTLLISGSAEAGSRVTVSIGGVSIGNTMANGSGTWTYDHTGTSLAEGTYSITAVAMDTAGNNSNSSSSFTAVIDVTAPSAPTVASISTDNGSSATDEITTDQTLIFSGTAEANSTVEVFIGGVSIGTTTADGSGDWDFDHTGTTLAEGSYSVTAEATDAAGNTSNTSSPLSVVIDLTAPNAPVVVSISTDSGLSNSDEITNDKTLEISGTAEANSTVGVFIGGVSMGTTTANGAGSWTYDYTGTTLSEGTYSFTATATDAASNTSNTSSALSVKIDETAPNAPIVSRISTDSGSSSSDQVTSDQTLEFSGTAEAGSSVEVFIGGVSIGTTTANGSGNWTYDHSGTTLLEGSYSVTAEATDTAGNTSSTSSALSVEIDITAPNSPVVSSISTDSGLSNSDEITNDQSLVISGTAEALGRLELLLTTSSGTSSLGFTNVDASGNWTFDYTGTNIAEGSHTGFIARVSDKAGNQSAYGAYLEIEIDITAPNAPVLSGISTDSGSSSSDEVTSDQTLEFTGTAEAGSEVEVFIGGVSIGTTRTNLSGNWTYDHTGTSLNEGTYSITAEATDTAGNTSSTSSSMSVVVDITAPNAPVVASISDDNGLSS
ncbi:MAG: choice-of-anchor D domain-containing protein, partial [Bacteroidia bacterium]